MRRVEARVARENLRQLAAAGKSARLVERLMAEIPTKQPRSPENPNSVYGMRMTWALESADLEEAWSWGVARQWTAADWDQIIQPKLAELERLTWGEIDRFSTDTGHKAHHGMLTDMICEEAQYRLVEIEQLEDTMFRFRLGNLPRLWGFRTVAHFEIVWYDPTHQIYPVDVP